MESTTYNRRMGGSRYQPNDEMSSDIPVDSERITDAPAVAAGSPLSSRLFTPLVESIVNDSLRPLHLSLYLQEARRFADESEIDSSQIVSDFASYHPDDDSERISSINHSFRAFRADKSRKTYTSTKRTRRKNDQVGRHAQKLSEFSEVYEFGHHLDLSRAARRPENPFESTTGIIPGDRGKDGGSWCRRPLTAAMRNRGNITSSSGRCHDRSVT